MKQFVKIFVPVAAAAIALFSCAKETKAPVPEGIEISVSAAVDEIDAPATASKTYMGASNTILWGEAEQMKIAITGEATVFANSASTNAYNGQKQATFSFTLTPPAGSSFLHQGIYPASAAMTSENNNPASYKVELPAVQAATAASYDPAAYILVAYPQSFDEVKTEWKAYFRRATALNKITLTGLSEDIVSVEFTAPEGAVLAGRRHIDLSTGESGDIYYGGTNVLKVNYAAALTGASKAVWFTSWEAAIPEGQTLKVVAKSATKSYTRTITARADGIKFLEGKLNLLEVDMSSAQEEDLVDYSGAYLIASIKDSKWYLMDPANTGTIYPYLATDLTADPANDEYSLFDGIQNIDDYVFTVAAYDGAYSIKSESTGKYVAYHGSSNEAYAADELGDDVKIDISYDAATKVAELASVNVSGRHLVFNSSQPRFAFYTSAQAGVYLIPAVADPRTPVTLSFDEPNIEVASTVAGGFSGQIVTSDPAVTGIEYSWDGEDAFGTLDEATGEVLLNGIAGSATITATFAGDSQYRPATASYTLSVIDPNKIYYVKVTAALSDWSGEYLIVNETHNVAWDAALSDLDATPNTFAVTIVNGKIERTDGTEGKQFEIAPMEGGYSILASNGKYIGRTASSNGVSVSDNPLLNTISWTDNHPVITGGESGRTISYNANSGQEKFRYLGTSDISLFKKNDPRPVCATPTFSVAEGAVEAGTVVTISTATDGADIYYSTNGSNPTADSGIKGTSVTIDANTTLKAIAVKAGYKSSPVASAVYTVAGAITPGSQESPYTVAQARAAIDAGTGLTGVYATGIISQIVTAFNSQFNNTTFNFSADGLTTSDQLQAYRIVAASADDYLVGDGVIVTGNLTKYNSTYEFAAACTAYALVHMPVIASGEENFTSSTSVELSCSTAGATIYYTIDGSAPTASSSVYSAPLNLTATATVKAIAVKDGLASGVVSKTFNKVQAYAVTFAQPANGSIVVKHGATTLSSGDVVAQGETITITATPAEGYSLSSLIYNDGSDHDITNSKSFTMPGAAVSITATFEAGQTAEPELVYTLDGNTTGGTNGYATESDITQDNIAWKVTGNTTMAPWRIGGKGAVVRPVYSATAISANITSIAIEHGSKTCTVNSLKVTVHNSAADAASGSNAIATFTITTAIDGKTTTVTKADNTSWAGKFYRFEYDLSCASGTNQYLQLKNIKFTGIK